MTAPAAPYIPGDPTSCMGPRIGAYIIDVLIGWAVMTAVFLAVAERVDNSGFELCDIEGSPTICLDIGNSSWFAEGARGWAVTLAGVGVWMLMGIVMQGMTGATPGKHMVGLRVVGEDSQLADFGRCAARSALWVVDAFPFIFPLVGLITGASTKGHRRVGDMVASTFVVKKELVGTGFAVPGVTGGAGGVAAPAPPPASWGSPPPAQSPPGTFPSPPPVAPPVAAPTPAAAPSTEPQWNAEREAWVAWDASASRWMAFDAAAGTWVPIS